MVRNLQKNMHFTSAQNNFREELRFLITGKCSCTSPALCTSCSVTTWSRCGHDAVTMQSRRVLWWSRRGHDRATTGSRRGQRSRRVTMRFVVTTWSRQGHDAVTTRCETQSPWTAASTDSPICSRISQKNQQAGLKVEERQGWTTLTKIAVMLEAFHIMLAGEYWLSKAIAPQISSSGLIAPVQFSTTTNASMKLFLTGRHLSLVLPVACCACENRVNDCCCYQPRSSHDTERCKFAANSSAAEAYARFSLVR